jgi:hypothetical protein
MVTSDWSDFLAVDWLTMEHIPIRIFFFVNPKGHSAFYQGL